MIAKELRATYGAEDDDGDDTLLRAACDVCTEHTPDNCGHRKISQLRKFFDTIFSSTVRTSTTDLAGDLQKKTVIRN